MTHKVKLTQKETSQFDSNYSFKNRKNMIFITLFYLAHPLQM